MYQFEVMGNEQDGSPLCVKAREAIHQLLQVTPILSERGFIENDEGGTKCNARGKCSSLLLSDGEGERAARSKMKQVCAG